MAIVGTVYPQSISLASFLCRPIPLLIDVHSLYLFSLNCRDYPLLLVEEYMSHGDLLGVLKDSRPFMPLLTQLDIAYQVADAMDYLANVL